MEPAKVSVLVPFYADDSDAGRQRLRVWGWNRRRWEKLVQQGLIDELVIGRDPLFIAKPEVISEATYLIKPRPFSVARALNDAAKHTHTDRWLLFGADHVPDPYAVAWAASELNRHPFVRIYDRIAYATSAATRVILSDAAFPLELADWHEAYAPCPGVLGVRRAAWEAAGGMDERYEGWGYEDTDFLDRLLRAFPSDHRGVNGRLRASGWTLRELHVPTARDLNGPNKTLYEGDR